jgi:DNA invertase Pin-like site-specific DNA recombinase
MPEANNTVIGIMAILAQDERERISARTKAALVEARKRGVRLGNPHGAAPLQAWLKVHGHSRRIRAARARADSFASLMAPIIADVEETGIVSHNGVAKELNRREIQTSRGSVGAWTDATVSRIRRRLQPAPEAA